MTAKQKNEKISEIEKKIFDLEMSLRYVKKFGGNSDIPKIIKDLRVELAELKNGR